MMIVSDIKRMVMEWKNMNINKFKKIECWPLILALLILGGCMTAPPGSSGRVDGGILSGGVETEWETPGYPSPLSNIETNTTFVKELEECKLISQGSDACLCYANVPKDYLVLDSFWMTKCPHTSPSSSSLEVAIPLANGGDGGDSKESAAETIPTPPAADSSLNDLPVLEGTCRDNGYELPE